jgi:hypothetical protein
MQQVERRQRLALGRELQVAEAAQRVFRRILLAANSRR